MKDNQILKPSLETSFIGMNTAIAQLNSGIGQLVGKKPKHIEVECIASDKVIAYPKCVHGFDDTKACQDCLAENGEGMLGE